MISLNALTLRRGARTLLENATLTIYPGWRVGVIGRNGTGKSTLFAAIHGELDADQGSLSRPKELAIATVAQETPSLPDLAIEFVLDGDVELRELESRLSKAEANGDVEKIAAIHERLATIGGYAARSRAATLMHGLGFAPGAESRPVASFSGGWRMRLNLARALMCRSDLLLLDEPTNHLDLDAVIWLQDWLKSYPGTLLVISHDREFLDAVTTQTLHLENQKATLYTGNYSQFERQRAEQLTLQAAQFERQQREIAHLQNFIRRFKAKASKATQAQSRVKALERMELVAAVHADSEFSFSFPEPERLPAPLVRLDKAQAGYGETVILRGLKLLVGPGDRIGLLGPNGAGKSTLVQTLAGAIPPLAGTAMRDPHLRVGYFAQHTTDSLDPQASPMLHLKRVDPQANEQALRNFLGSFNFRGDRALEAVGPFSGGEKARLALALVVYQRPNLLLLDEPTNHLDLDMRHALEQALLDYPGALVVVSHDRHLLTSTCEDFWLVANGEAQPFDGDLDEYTRWLRNRDSAAPAGTPNAAASPRRDTAELRTLTKPLRDTINKLDKQMAKLQSELSKLDDKLADNALYEAARAPELRELQQRQSQLRQQLDDAETQWLDASEQLESLEAGA
ncbi:ATP-binding cassette domain-containing protein [Solimonas marina]|uniref:Probable ATP-binding protein YheS n=1 Tax=Solimonas marina TaxID=2714601 RepID=A0A970B6S3_9GAMM|nr:ATP-binding cassette domain-containing protein [Solimonas marina]NKF23123.1 ATP-binding cassette domain-containing protein [Solimonas marina]